LSAAILRAETGSGFAHCLRTTASRLYETWGSLVLVVLHTVLRVPQAPAPELSSLGEDSASRSRSDTMS
jgi:hypothetical protein